MPVKRMRRRRKEGIESVAAWELHSFNFGMKFIYIYILTFFFFKPCHPFNSRKMYLPGR